MSYKLQHPLRLLSSVDELKMGLYLWVWYPELKSPHLGISQNGRYYSLQFHNKQMDISLATMEGVIQRKKVPVLFLKIESELDVSDINAVFMNYSSCEIDCCSCSAPLLRLFNVTKKDAILFDILETMEKSNRISTCIGINLPQNFRAIPAYTYADVKHNLLQFTP